MRLISIHRVFPIAALMLLVLTAIPSMASDKESMEYSVKAAMIYNIAKFVEWPEDGGGQEFVICVVGEDPFGGSLDALDGKRIKDQTVKVKRVGSAAEARGSRIVFLSSISGSGLDEAIRVFRSGRSLVISDAAGFARRGGDIGFVIVENKVRFEINNSSVGSKGLKVSSRLLKLADTVFDEGY